MSLNEDCCCRQENEVDVVGRKNCTAMLGTHFVGSEYLLMQAYTPQEAALYNPCNMAKVYTATAAWTKEYCVGKPYTPRDLY
jgi:hypothetical protein